MPVSYLACIEETVVLRHTLVIVIVVVKDNASSLDSSVAVDEGRAVLEGAFHCCSNLSVVDCYWH